MTESKSIHLILLASLLLTVTACTRPVPTTGKVRTAPLETPVPLSKIELPEDATAVPSLDLFNIPDGLVAYPDDALYVPPSREIYLTSSSEPVIKKLDDKYWLVAQDSPSVVWQSLRNFFAGNLSIKQEKPEQGLIESGWIAVQGKDLEVNYSVKVESGLLYGSSEVRVWRESRQGQQTSAKRIDLEMMQFVLDYLKRIPRSSNSLRARDLDTQTKLTAEITVDGTAYIIAKIDYDRSWSALILALQKAEINIIERDKNTGTLTVAFFREDEVRQWPNRVDVYAEQPTVGSRNALQTGMKVAAKSTYKSVEQGHQRRVRVQAVDDGSTYIWVERVQLDDKNQARLTSLILQNIN